jgi:hypothetical protein
MQVCKIINCFTSISVAEKNKIIDQFRVSRESTSDFFDTFSNDFLKVALVDPDMNQVVLKHLGLQK